MTIRKDYLYALQERNMYACMNVCHGKAEHPALDGSTLYFAQTWALTQRVACVFY